jgi:CRISPR-associated endonuclease Cas1
MDQPVSRVAHTFSRDASAHDVCVADGYGIRIHVQHGHLIVTDGIGRQRRERRYPRAGHGLRRLIVVGHTGYVTLDAHRWIAETGLAYLHIDTDGRVLTTSGRLGIDQPALRRAQALAPGDGSGLAITQTLLESKLSGQARVARALGSDHVAETIADLLRVLQDAPDQEACRRAEAVAAKAYWNDVWATRSVTFARRDQARVPKRWLTFGSRHSELPTAYSPRRATNPANAILNYLYALGEAEASLALRGVGLDPGLGFLHADAKARDSAALDLLEAIRPDIDAYVAQLIAQRTFARSDFVELPDGTCRVLPPLTHELARTSLSWAQAAGPHAEHVTTLLAASRGRTEVPPTPLTQSKRAARYANARSQQGARRPRPAQLPERTCPGCGGPPGQGKQAWCPACLPGQLAQQGSVGGLRRMGKVTGELTKAKQRAALAEHQEACAAWNRVRANENDDETYKRDVLPRVLGQPIQVITKATGLSRAYASRVRRGLVIPHPRHWKALRKLGDSSQ